MINRRNLDENHSSGKNMRGQEAMKGGKTLPSKLPTGIEGEKWRTLGILGNCEIADFAETSSLPGHSAD